MADYEAETRSLVSLYTSYNKNVPEYTCWYHQFTQQAAIHQNSDNAN